MLRSHEQTTNKNPASAGKKLRTACDVCHQSKMKCSGGKPCSGCRDAGYDCSYSFSNRSGRPKGTKNKRTLERMNGKKSGSSENTENDRSSPVQAQPLMTALNNGVGSSTVPGQQTSIDSMLDTSLEDPRSLGMSEPFGPFSDDMNSWFDLGELSGTSPLTQQSSSSATFVSDALDLPRTYSHDSAIDLSFSNIFNEKEGSGSAQDLSELLSGVETENENSQAMTTSSSSSPLTSVSTCNCVQNNAELLCRLKELEQRHVQPRLDVVLSSAQQALVPWKSVIECRVCQHDDNQEVLILSAMSIRTVLRSLKNLCLEYYNSMSSSRDTRDQQQAAAKLADGMQSAIGMYEIPGEEREAVKNLLIRLTLGKVKYTLACFKERLEKLEAKKKSSATHVPDERTFPGDIGPGVETLQKGGPGDFDHLIQVWRNLGDTVQTLERVLENGNDLPRPL
ncbi:C6 transcription factor GliZ, partial [Lecanoromycetidae sp. Uapishka_2]